MATPKPGRRSSRRATMVEDPVARIHGIRREIDLEMKHLGLTYEEYHTRRMAVLRKKGFPV